jgi:hypothetical protein
VSVNWKWVLRITAGLVVLVALVVVLVSSRGSFERIPVGGAGGATSPDGAVCLSEKPRADRRLLERCVHVRGTLLWVRRGYSDDGRLIEIHLLVSAHFHLYVVKLIPPLAAHLHLGHEVTAVGPLLETEPSHFGINEVEAFSFSGGS